VAVIVLQYHDWLRLIVARVLNITSVKIAVVAAQGSPGYLGSGSFMLVNA
jgi:hypothetical protein